MPLPVPGAPNEANPYFTLNVWSADSKSGAALVTTSPVTNVVSVGRQLDLNAPYQFTIDLPLVDPSNAGFYKGYYAELEIGWARPQTLWVSGYLDQVEKNWTRPGVYNITLHSAMTRLSEYNTLGGSQYPYPAYQSVFDFLNGVQPAGQVPKPGQMGVLPPGWQAVPSPGHYDSTAGKWVADGWTPPGLGDEWRGDFQTSLQSLQAICTHYKLFSRERLGSTYGSGIIEMGPLGDACLMPDGVTPFACWGGYPLEQQLLSAYPNLPVPLSELADKLGLVQIEQADRIEVESDIHNLIWVVGHNYKGRVTTIRRFFKGDPVNKQGGLRSGVTKWPVSGDPEYVAGMVPMYVRPNLKVDWQGHTFELVARQGNSGEYFYGIVDRTSAAEYGIREAEHHDPHAQSQDQLLSAGFGALEASTNPITSWTLQLEQPRHNASQVPVAIMPGQTIEVNLEAKVPVPNVYSAADGMWEPAPGESYDLMRFPTAPGDDDGGLKNIDAAQLALLKNCVSVSDQLGAESFTQSLTLGRSKPDNRRLTDDYLVKAFERDKHAPVGGHHASVKRRDADDIPFWLTKASTGPPLLYDAEFDLQNQRFVLSGGPEPGYSLAVADVPREDFLSEHRHVSFVVATADRNGIFDFWFCKPLDDKLDNPATTDGPYGLVRLAGPGVDVSTATNKCGIYSVATDGTLTSRGALAQDAKTYLLDGSGRLKNAGAYLFRFEYSGGRYHAVVSMREQGIDNYLWIDVPFANWLDSAPPPATPVLGTGGTGTTASRSAPGVYTLGTGTEAVGLSAGDFIYLEGGGIATPGLFVVSSIVSDNQILVNNDPLSGAASGITWVWTKPAEGSIGFCYHSALTGPQASAVCYVSELHAQAQIVSSTVAGTLAGASNPARGVHWRDLYVSVWKWDKTNKRATVRVRPEKNSQHQNKRYGQLLDASNHQFYSDDNTPAYWEHDVYVKNGEYGDTLIYNASLQDVTSSTGGPIHPNTFGFVNQLLVNKETYDMVILVGDLSQHDDRKLHHPIFQPVWGHHFKTTKPARGVVHRGGHAKHSPPKKKKGKTPADYDGVGFIIHHM